MRMHSRHVQTLSDSIRLCQPLSESGHACYACASSYRTPTPYQTSFGLQHCFMQHNMSETWQLTTVYSAANYSFRRTARTARYDCSVSTRSSVSMTRSAPPSLLAASTPSATAPGGAAGCRAALVCCSAKPRLPCCGVPRLLAQPCSHAKRAAAACMNSFSNFHICCKLL